jgi:hypothetical protein
MTQFSGSGTESRSDISPYYAPNIHDSKVTKRILRYEGTGRAVVELDKYKSRLTDYGYWFLLSTLWVSYTGYSDLRLWKRLFQSNRPNRKDCLMKPSEVQAFADLPEEGISIYRAKRPNETDCIAYTLDFSVAANWAINRGVNEVHCYSVDKRHITALFLRRNERELIVLDTNYVNLQKIQAVTISQD